MHNATCCTAHFVNRGEISLKIGTFIIIGTFLNDLMMILHKMVLHCLLDILKHLCTTKCLVKYQRLQFYGLYVPILDETLYVVTKCTVCWAELQITDSAVLAYIFAEKSLQILLELSCSS